MTTAPRSDDRDTPKADAAAATAALAGGNETQIPLPHPGEIIVIELQGVTAAKFAFDPDRAQTTVEGDDLVLTVNGGEIVLVGYLAELRSGALPTFLSPLSELISPDALLSRPGGQEPGHAANGGFVAPE